MNRHETAQLLAMVQAFDRRTVGETDVLAWADVLTDTDYADAQTAVRQHFRDSREWLMPADIRKRVKAIRDDRLSRQPAPAPGHELTDDARRYLASLNRNIRSIADGRSVDLALRRAEPADNPEYQEARPDRNESRIQSLTVGCPWCHAASGDPCVSTANGAPLTATAAHHARLEAAGLTEDTAKDTT